jgi:hypothetical protein
MWFIHEYMSVEPAKVKEIFIDVTYNISKMPNYLYAVVSQELGYRIPLGFMLMKIHSKKDTKSKKHANEALECNKNFYGILRELGVIPRFVHTDKDMSEISASQVISLPCLQNKANFTESQCLVGISY